MIDDIKYSELTVAIDKLHSEDSVMENVDGNLLPAELVYSKRMLQILETVFPGSDNLLKISAQCQHLKRWMIVRTDFPMDRQGYHKWRRVVMNYQLDETGKLLYAYSVSETDINKILDSLKNQGAKGNSDSQVIEDTACLVFLKWYLKPFADKHEPDKVLDILRKTLRKVSEKGLNAAADIDLSKDVLILLDKALGRKE